MSWCKKQRPALAATCRRRRMIRMVNVVSQADSHLEIIKVFKATTVSITFVLAEFVSLLLVFFLLKSKPGASMTFLPCCFVILRRSRSSKVFMPYTWYLSTLRRDAGHGSWIGNLKIVILGCDENL